MANTLTVAELAERDIGKILLRGPPLKRTIQVNIDIRTETTKVIHLGPQQQAFRNNPQTNTFSKM